MLLVNTKWDSYSFYVKRLKIPAHCFNTSSCFGSAFHVAFSMSKIISGMVSSFQSWGPPIATLRTTLRRVPYERTDPRSLNVNMEKLSGKESQGSKESHYQHGETKKGGMTASITMRLTTAYHTHIFLCKHTSTRLVLVNPSLENKLQVSTTSWGNIKRLTLFRRETTNYNGWKGNG